jgi:hypothetical protein
LKLIKILLITATIVGLALVPQASYAEEANNACVAGSPCGEAILAGFVVEDYKNAIIETKFYDVNENEILSVQMSYSTDKFQEKIHLPVGKYHIKTSVIGLENGHNNSSSEKLYTFDIYGNIEVKDNEVASFRTFVGNEDLMYKYGWIVNFPFANKPEDYGGVYDLNMLKTLENKYANEVLGKPMKEKYKQQQEAEKGVIVAEEESKNPPPAVVVRTAFVLISLVIIIYLVYVTIMYLVYKAASQNMD